MLKSWVHVSGDRVTIHRFVPLGSMLYAQLVLLSPSCKISYFSLPGVHYNRYTCILLGYRWRRAIPIIRKLMPL